MRFLHLADVHLDTLFAGRSPQSRDRLREASREAFRRAISFAMDRSVDAVLVAGDLFDGSRLSFHTERFLHSQLDRLGEAGIPFLYCTGNHDPGSGLAGSARITWPDHVELFADPEPRTVTVERGGRPVGTVTAAGHATDREGTNLSLGFRGSPERTLPAVAMLHTQVLGAGGAALHERYAPSELPFLRESAFDYWALGHIHLRERLEAMPAIHYPGNLQGRSPRETGGKGGLLVEIDAPGTAPRVEFVEFGPIRWEVLELGGLEEITTFDDLVAAIRDGWSRARDADPGPPDAEWMLRVRLSGACPLAGELDVEENRVAAAREVESTLDLLEAELRTGELRSSVDASDLREQQDPAGAALRLLDRLDAPGGGKELLQRLGITGDDLAGLPASPEGRDDPGAYLERILGPETGRLILADRFLDTGRGR